MKLNYGDLWAETQANGQTYIGFTQQCIVEKLGECFHVLPADVGRAKLDSPLLVLETNDGLQSLKSPINGKVMFFNDKARDFPDKLVNEDIIMILAPFEKKPKITPKNKESKKYNFVVDPFVVAPDDGRHDDFFN